MVLQNEDGEIFDEIVKRFMNITDTFTCVKPSTLEDICCVGTRNEYNILSQALEKRYFIKLPMLSGHLNRSSIKIKDLAQYILEHRENMTLPDSYRASIEVDQKEDTDEGEHNGGDVNYYVAEITDPKRFDAYTAEAEDIIEALDMSFSEGTAFKSIWRKAAERTLGKIKQGSDALYNAQKVYYYGGRMVAIEEKKLKDE